MHKKLILSCASICLIICVFLSAYRTPIPILDDGNNYQIAWILYNEAFEDDGINLKHITEFDEEAILRCISKYDQKRTFNIYRGSHSRLEIDIYIIAVNGGSISITLGEEDFCIGFDDDMKREIINSSELQNELKTLILKGKS